MFVTPGSTARDLRALLQNLVQSGLPTLEPLIPLALRLDGRPMTLEDHYPFSPLYFVDQVPFQIVKSGRQVSKSTNQAGSSLLISLLRPRFRTLFVTPLYEMVRRFSQNVMRPFIESSPVRGLIAGQRTSANVLQRTLRNESMMVFTFAGSTVGRTRGISADRLAIDEVQDMDRSFLPVLGETMSASRHKLWMLSGTPLSVDNTIELEWQSSSQAHWNLTCPSCSYRNVASEDRDLDAICGPWRADISKARPALVCRKCRKPLRPRDPQWSYWVHDFPERARDRRGLHVPQHIMPMHFEDPKAWAILLDKRAERHGYSRARYLNEVAGESHDTGDRLLAQSELKAACRLGPRSVAAARQRLSDRDYIATVMGCDWGGGGQEGESRQALVVAGLRSDATVDVHYGRLNADCGASTQAATALALFREFNPSALAHDYASGGAYQQILADAGVPVARMWPMRFVPHAGGGVMCRRVPPTQHDPTHHWNVDKGRALATVCEHIRSGNVRFFEWDWRSKEEQGMVNDFMSLFVNRRESWSGSDGWTVMRTPGLPDDFTHAVAYACCAAWELAKRQPPLKANPKLDPLLNGQLLDSLQRDWMSRALLEEPEVSEWASDAPWGFGSDLRLDLALEILVGSRVEASFHSGGTALL